MNKSGLSTILYFRMVGLVMAITVFIVLFNYVEGAYTDTTFEKSIQARDLALLITTVMAAPGDVEFFFETSTDYRYRILSFVDENPSVPMLLVQVCKPSSCNLRGDSCTVNANCCNNDCNPFGFCSSKFDTSRTCEGEYFYAKPVSWPDVSTGVFFPIVPVDFNQPHGLSLCKTGDVVKIFSTVVLSC